MTLKTGSHSPFTAKFTVGELVAVIDGGNWADPSGRVVKINSLKTSHHYQVQLPGEEWNKFWFSEWELQRRDDEVPGGYLEIA